MPASELLANQLMQQTSVCEALNLFTIDMAQVLGGVAIGYIFIYLFLYVILPMIGYGVGKNTLFGFIAGLIGNTIIVLLGAGGCILMPVEWGIVSGLVYILAIGMVIVILKYGHTGTW